MDHDSDIEAKPAAPPGQHPVMTAEEYTVGASRLDAALVTGALRRDPAAPRTRTRAGWDALVANERSRPISQS